MAYTKEQGNSEDEGRASTASTNSNSSGGIVPGELTPWNVMKAIPGTIGSFDLIAGRLNLPRLEVRRYIMGNKELREAIDDDILAAQERIRLQTYKDGLDGQPQARQDFFKMVNGYFEKRDSAASQKSNEPKTSLVLHVDEKPKTYKMLSAGGEVVDVDLSELKKTSVASSDGNGDGNADEGDKFRFAGFADGVHPSDGEPEDDDDLDFNEDGDNSEEEGY